MSLLKRLFGPPDIEYLKLKNNSKGMIRALSYKKDLDIVKKAVKELGLLRSMDAAQPIMALLKENNEELQKIAIESLGLIGNPDAVRSLTSLLDKNSSHFKEIVFDALINIGNPGVKSLISILKVKELEVQNQIIEILIKIGSKHSINSILSVLTKNYHSSLKDTVPLVKKNLGKEINMNHVSAIYGISTGKLEFCLGLGNDFLPISEIFLKSESLLKRDVVEIIKILGKYGYVEILKSLLEYENKSFAEHVFKELYNIGKIDEIIPYLSCNSWSLRKKVAEILKENEWKPKKIVDKTNYFIALGNISEIRKLDQNKIKTVLIEFLECDMKSVNLDIKGGIAKILLRPNFISDDSIIQWAKKEVEIYSKKCYESLIERFESKESRYGRKIFSINADDYSEFITDIGSYKSSSTSNPGLYGTRFFYDTDKSLKALKELCKIKTVVSSNLLHHISKMADTEVVSETFEVEYDQDHPSGMGEKTKLLSFSDHRSLAKKELKKRNNPEYNYSVYKLENCWQIIK